METQKIKVKGFGLEERGCWKLSNELEKQQSLGHIREDTPILLHFICEGRVWEMVGEGVWKMPDLGTLREGMGNLGAGEGGGKGERVRKVVDQRGGDGFRGWGEGNRG
ncbi:hypothetical protein ACH5RR_016656 [Cinchona calisaya]|uniref:Uncharacterized protein n=1 Tax=Cinchona calisaya TaxID=153742 RepID=A0ABD2ZZ91_9GENT